MFKNFSLFLAWRYLTGAKKERSVSIMVAICFTGIFIGSFALALIASIMNGFEKVTHEKIRGINPQIIMHSYGQELNFNAIANNIKNDLPEVIAIAPTSVKQLIIQSDFNDKYSISLLKGINPKLETGVCDFSSKFVNNIHNNKNNTPENTKSSKTNNSQTNNSQINNSQANNSLESIISGNKVIIGQKMAEDLKIKIGDTINLFYSSDEKIKGNKIKLNQVKATVGQIFKTGLEEYDTSLIICNFDLFNQIFPDTGVTQIGLQINESKNEQAIIEKLKNKFGKFDITCYSWKELYPALVEALKLEKYAMFLILALITLVASMNIISLLFMQIIQKRPDIAILKAMGMQNTQISKIFFNLGMTISIAGCSLGLFFAFIAGFILENYPIIKLPDAYYVTHLPAKMDWSIFFAVFITVILLTALTTWLPINRAKKINISHVLRFEG